MNNEIQEIDIECLEIISEYTQNDKLHPDFIPLTTYDMIQSGYPQPNKGIMIARCWGGTDSDDRLLPSNGMWCKVEDVRKLLEKHGIYLNKL